MNFLRFFKEHILPEKIYILNVSFVIDELKESFGGTAGNIAYNLSLLKESSVVLGIVGNDFAKYKKRFKKLKKEFPELNKIVKNNTIPTGWLIEQIKGLKGKKLVE
ncbi:MAG: hypothetical protein U9N04_04840 [Patescibacteria group bacterium]|nr:hypothetical protein [Patescibacteria group bacterium]